MIADKVARGEKSRKEMAGYGLLLRSWSSAGQNATGFFLRLCNGASSHSGFHC